MPDTGFMSPDNVVAQANVSFDTEWITFNSGLIVFANQGNGTQTVDGFENSGTLPIGATVVGAEVVLYETYGISNPNFDVQLSINGGSSFSSAIRVNVGSVDADHTYGSPTQLWGLDWSNFSDLSLIQLKGTTVVGNNTVISDHPQLKIYYDAPVGPLKIESGAKIQIVSGKFLID
jgi:hypothetical protein